MSKTITHKDVVPKNEIEQFRTADEFVLWWKECRDRIGSLVEDNPSLKREANTKSNPYVKKYYEEVFPLSRLLKEKKSVWKDIKFRNVFSDSLPFDAEVSGLADFEFIEITTDCSYMSSLRDEHLEDKGWAASGDCYTRESGAVKLKEEGQVLSSEEIVNRTLEIIKKRISNKISNNKYSKKHALLVCFEDWILCEDLIHKIKLELKKFLDNCNDIPFFSIFVVGSREFFYEYVVS